MRESMRMMPMRVSRRRVRRAVKAKERMDKRVWSKELAVVGVRGRREDVEEGSVLRSSRVHRRVGACLEEGSGMMWRREARRAESHVMLV